MFFTQPVVRTQATLSLPFAKQFLVTGNYVVGSVDLLPANTGTGELTGTLPMAGVPANAEVISAYLYWEILSTSVTQNDGAKFRGEPITVAKKTFQTGAPVPMLDGRQSKQ
jgi:hypothetical protein